MAGALVGAIIIDVEAVIVVAGRIVGLTAIPELKRARIERGGRETATEVFDVERLAKVERFRFERDELTTMLGRCAAELHEIAAKDARAERRLVVVGAELTALGES